MQNLTKNQKKTLLSNPNVLKLLEKQVIFKPEFKVRAVELLLEGLPPNEIFLSHDLDPNFFVHEYCRNLTRKWRDKYLLIGKESLLVETRGRGQLGKKSKESLDNMCEDDLKSIIAAQNEVIEQLKKTKALARKK